MLQLKAFCNLFKICQGFFAKYLFPSLLHRGRRHWRHAAGHAALTRAPPAPPGGPRRAWTTPPYLLPFPPPARRSFSLFHSSELLHRLRVCRACRRCLAASRADRRQQKIPPYPPIPPGAWNRAGTGRIDAGVLNIARTRPCSGGPIRSSPSTPSPR